MVKQIIHFSVLFLALVFLQVLVGNHICLFDVATPALFIYFIIRLPITMPTNWILTLSFFIGLCIDIFSDTPGMNALAAVIIGGLRIPVIRLYVPRREEISDPIPSLNSFGVTVYLRYILTITLCFCFVIAFIESFIIKDILKFVLRIIGSTALTTVIILGMDGIVNLGNGKRL